MAEKEKEKARMAALKAKEEAKAEAKYEKDLQKYKEWKEEGGAANWGGTDLGDIEVPGLGVIPVVEQATYLFGVFGHPNPRTD